MPSELLAVRVLGVSWEGLGGLQRDSSWRVASSAALLWAGGQQSPDGQRALVFVEWAGRAGG